MISQHNQESIDSMVDEFKSLNGHTTKEDWKVLFKYYVPTYQPSVYNNNLPEEFDESVFILPQKNEK